VRITAFQLLHIDVDQAVGKEVQTCCVVGPHGTPSSSNVGSVSSGPIGAPSDSSADLGIRETA